jgi:hypothetical protein
LGRYIASYRFSEAVAREPAPGEDEWGGEGGKMATKFLLSDGCVMARRRIIKVCEKLVRRNSCVR